MSISQISRLSYDLQGRTCTHLYFFSLSQGLILLFFQCILSCSRKLKLNLEFLPSLFSLSFCFVNCFLLLSIIFRIGYLYLFFILFVLFSFGFLCAIAFISCSELFVSLLVFPAFYFPFVDSLALLFCCQSQNGCETSVSCGFALFCTTFFFYVFVCYKLSWFINPSRLFKGVCITKQEK